VGASGKVALLLSGGIDSPVAGHLMQKRGCTLAAVYFHSFPYTGERTRDKVARLAALLAPAQGGLSLLVAHFTEIQQRIRNGAPAEMAVILYRRSMLRIATRLALKQGCGALASGENLGQVASQTLENLACIQLAAGLPVLRPLLTYDKAETIALARRIGTYELSIEPYDDCCSLFVPRHPLTRARAGEVEQAESKLSLEPLEALAEEGVDLLEIS
jgi:thiamine biosynthesis protein ThiI